MATPLGFNETFDTLSKSMWYVSDFTQSETWIHNSWSKNNAEILNGELHLTLDTIDKGGKNFTGGEIQTNGRFGYGTYDVTMKSSGQTGVNSSFFTYTGPYFGDNWNEIDFEFLGKAPTKVNVAYHYGGLEVSKSIDLGFDASKGFHHYSFDWKPDGIRWFADGRLLHEVKDDGTANVPIPDTSSKLYMNIWTGINSWLGTPTFKTETAAVYRDVSFKPMDGAQTTPVGTTNGLLVTLIDSSNGRPIATLTDGAVIGTDQIGNKPVTIMVRAVDGSIRNSIESVVFDVDGPTDYHQVEGAAPYCLFGNPDSGRFHGKVLGIGDYALHTEAWSDPAGAGRLLSALDLDFRIVQGSGAVKPDTSGITITVIDTTTGEVLSTLQDGAVLDVDMLGSGKLSFIATSTKGTDVKSMVFDMHGALEHKQIENAAPWAIFGDRAPLFHGRDFATGEYELTVKAFAKIGGSGGAIADRELSFEIREHAAPPPAPPEDLQLYLFNAVTDTIISPLNDHGVVDLAKVGTGSLSVIAVPGVSGVESVKFSLKGAMTVDRTENLSQYSVFGKINPTDIAGKSLAIGDYTIATSGYSLDNLKGTKLAVTDIDFKVINSATMPASPVPTPVPVPAADWKFQLVNAESDMIVKTLADGDVIRMANYGTDNFSIIASSLKPGIESMVFDLDGFVSHRQVENSAPYALFGEGAAGYHGRDFVAGNYSIHAEAFERDGGSGRMLAAADLDLTFA